MSIVVLLYSERTPDAVQLWCREEGMEDMGTGSRGRGMAAAMATLTRAMVTVNIAMGSLVRPRKVGPIRRAALASSDKPIM